MCGIVAILDQAGLASHPSADELLGALDAAVHALDRRGLARGWRSTRMAAEAAVADAPAPGRARRAGARRPAVAGRRHRGPARPAGRVRGRRGGPGRGRPTPTRPSTSSETNAALVRAKDVLWALRRDRLRTAAAVVGAGRAGRPGQAALAGFLSVQLALSAIDRLEVRGRDSAGLHLFVWDHGLDLDDPELASRLAAPQRRPAVPVRRGPGGRRRAVVRLQGRGRDRRAGRQHRRAARRDPRRRAAPPGPGGAAARGSRCSATPAGPASASSPSPTPTRSTARRTGTARGGPYVVAALNGDVDNHADLRARSELSHPRRRSPPTPR